MKQELPADSSVHDVVYLTSTLAHANLIITTGTMLIERLVIGAPLDKELREKIIEYTHIVDRHLERSVDARNSLKQLLGRVVN